MIIETEINVYDVACRLTRTPEEMAYTLQEFALCDAASLGRDCAEHMTHDPRAEVAAWLRAFAGALAPEPEPAMNETTRLTAVPRRQRQADAWSIVARSIVANPKPEHTASLRLLAWATLKAERGQTVCQCRLRTRPAQADREVA